MRRTKEEAEQTREKIFRAGIKVFAEKGYSAGTLADVAREAGVTRGAIYWHFENKEAFFREMVARLNRSYHDLVEIARDSGQEPPRAIESAVAQIIRRFARDPEFRTLQELTMVTMMSHGDILGPHDQPYRHDEAAAVSILGEAMQKPGMYDGCSPTTALRSIEAMITGTFMMIREGRLDPTDEEIRHMAAFVRRGLTGDSMACR